MDLQTAQTLKANDLVADSDGKQYIFIKLDEENDLVVIHRAAMGGRIHLYREMCSKVESNS